MKIQTPGVRPIRRLAVPCGVLSSVVLLLAACGSGDDDPAPPAQPQALACDDNLKTTFKPDALTSVVLVKPFRKGEDLRLENTPAAVAPATTVKAPSDLCLVKLVVGPGKPGPAGAPSTSAGIGIEVWLPPLQTTDTTQTAWNEVIRAYGSGGWAGGFQADPTRIGFNGSTASNNGNFVSHIGAVAKGYVVATSDHGHGRNGNGSFTLNEDGTLNTTLWQDFAERSMHEQAVKAKALAQLYYGKPHKYAYWDGFSTGGRQGYKLAQKYPEDFNGILAGAPAFNWSRFITGELYPQVVMNLELGAPIATAKLNAASAAANAACGGATLGFQLDPLQCRYDPTRDAAQLCLGEIGNGVTGASTNVAACLTAREAVALNKIWYGMTRDGSVPEPALDNAGAPTLAGSHLWYGLTRGTNLTALAGAVPFAISSVQVALELLDPAYAQSVPAGTLANAAGANLGQDQWKTLDYAGLARAYDQGLVLQPSFSFINTDNPDLSALRDRGAKVLSYHGLADQLIPPQGSLHYFERVAAAMGGTAAVQQFNRLYMVPGMAHDGTFGSSASIDPATGTNAATTRVPLPQPATGRDELFNALRNWVENGQAPGRIDIASSDGSVTLPLCVYPQKAVLTGTVPTAAASYTCQ